MTATPWDPDHEYRIEPSETSIGEDGYAKGEPKFLACEFCGARVQLTEARDDPGIDDLAHAADCPNRFARSHWWRDRVQQAD